MVTVTRFQVVVLWEHLNSDLARSPGTWQFSELVSSVLHLLNITGTTAVSTLHGASVIHHSFPWCLWWIRQYFIRSESQPLAWPAHSQPTPQPEGFPSRNLLPTFQKQFVGELFALLKPSQCLLLKRSNWRCGFLRHFEFPTLSFKLHHYHIHYLNSNLNLHLQKLNVVKYLT